MARLVLIILVLAPVLGHAEFTPVFHPELKIFPTTGEITIDGVLSDGEWADAAVADNFAEHSPGDQVQPPVDTKVLVTFDEQNLYVAYICYDDPSTVRASFCRRDRIFQDDYAIVCLDPYGDGATAFELAANPFGIQGDLYYSTNCGEDISYDLIYETAGQITDEGWVVEYAIPFRSLRFPDKEEMTWKVDFWRNRPRDVRYQMSWAAYDRDESCWPCQWGTITGLRGIKPPKGLDLLPAIVGHQAGSREDEGEFENGKVVAQGSFTARYGLTSNISLEATVRPDFSQVESDAAQIDVNSKFALFYPEKRPFFMEGSDLFNTFFNAVYTRSVNDPTLAGKITGRAGKTSFAVLSAKDRNTSIILPFEEHSHYVENGESFSNIIRVKQEFGEQTSLGLVGTDRRYTKGGSGSLVGVDGRLRLNQNYSLKGQYLVSFTEEPEDSLLTWDFRDHIFDDGRHTEAFDGEYFTGHGLFAGFQRNGRHWSFYLNYWDRSPTFRAENGFETYNNQRLGSAQSNYLFRFDESPWLEWVNPSIYAMRSWNYDGQQKESLVQFTLESKIRWAQFGNHSYYNRGSEVYQSREYDDLWRLHVCLHITPSKVVALGANYNYSNQIYYAGEVIGRQTDYGGWLDLRPWDRLLLETSISKSRSRALKGEEVYFDGYVTRTKLSLQMTREFSLRLILQYNNFSELWEADPLLTYQLNPFSIFYIGSTRDYRQFTPNEPDEATWQLAQRQYFVKFQYLFRI